MSASLNHLEYFKEHSLDVSGYNNLIGKYPSTFSGLLKGKLSDERLSRKDLYEMVEKQDVPIDFLCLSILAWGGIHKNNITRAFVASEEWLDIASKIRAGAYSREDAYSTFRKVRDAGSMKGIGPAYYTKLIYFLMPENKKPRGYIMDQWVACSVNLLAGRNIVLMDANYKWSRSKANELFFEASEFTVSDINTSQNYEEFCQFIEALGKKIDRTPDETEFCLMAGGKNTRDITPWREYVIKNRQVYI